jgi:hypothetical protein
MRQGWIVAPPMIAAGSGASKFTDARNILRVSWVTAAWGSHRDGLMASIVSSCSMPDRLASLDLLPSAFVKSVRSSTGCEPARRLAFVFLCSRAAHGRSEVSG